MTELAALDPDFWLMILVIFLVSVAFGAILYRLSGND